MVRALRVSKSFSFVGTTSTRTLPSGKKLSFTSSSTDSSGCSPSYSCNGELPQQVGCAHLLPQRCFSLMGQENVHRILSNSIVHYVSARFSSSGAESEWPETDEEEEVQRGSEGGYKAEVETDGDEMYMTEEETDVGMGPPSQRHGGQGEGFSRDVHMERLGSRDKDAGRSRSIEKRGTASAAGSRSNYIRDSDNDYIEVESDLEGELQEEIERQMAAEPKFRRPSVTWGILLTSEDRRKARAAVFEYLESEGINTSELKRIELPTTVEVMQTRVGFLQKLGLNNDDINSYPLVLGCSVRKNMVPVLQYLKKIGITDTFLTIMIKKYPMILHASVVIDILPVVYFLRGLDIDKLDIPYFLSSYPDVLGFKIEGTMSTSVGYLVSLGVKTRHVGRMLTDYPEILGMRVAVVLKPKVEYLISLGIPQLIVAKIIERRPQIMGYDLEHRMKYNVNQLLSIGVHEKAIPGMVTQFPELLGRTITSTLESQIAWFKDHLEMDSNAIARLFEKMPQTIFMHREVASERIRFLESVHFTPKDIGVMAAQCPQILVLSIGERLRPNIFFLTRTLKRKRQEVLDFPAFFTYDLESRIKPRFNALGDNAAEWSLEWLLNCSDGEFKKRMSAGLGMEDEEGCSEHVFSMGGLLPGRLVKDEDEWQLAERPRELRRFAV